MTLGQNDCLIQSDGFLGKTVLVTGGGSGIGRAVALAFVRYGAAVAVAGRRAEPLHETVRLIEAAGGSGHAILADLTVSVQASALVR